MTQATTVQAATPGPYFFEPVPADWHTDPEIGIRKDSLFMVVDSRAAGEVLAIVEKVAGGFDQAQANARLLAGSWQLLEALKEIVLAFDLAIARQQIDGGTENSRIAQQARAAIAQVEAS